MRQLASWRRVRVSVVRERSDEKYEQPATVRSGRDVARMVRAFIGDDPREVFVAVYLDTRHRPIVIHACSVGTAGSAPVHPCEVFAPALLACASALVIAHNHPSGDPAPSPEDRAVTERLRQVGELLGIEVLDHLVIGAERFYSFAGESFEPWEDR